MQQPEAVCGVHAGADEPEQPLAGPTVVVEDPELPMVAIRLNARCAAGWSGAKNYSGSGA